MNMPIRGWNEGLIVYVLAASSPTHPVSAEVYRDGWGNFTFPVAVNQPLFFAHYSFLGLDPRNLSDSNGSYWEQNVAHARPTGSRIRSHWTAPGLHLLTLQLTRARLL